MAELFYKIDDPDYYANVLEDIRTTSDMITLNNVLKILSIKIHNQEIDLDKANEINQAIKNRIRALNNSKFNNNYSTTSFDNNLGRGLESGNSLEHTTGSKTLTMHPVKSGNTAVSNRRGSAAMVFIIANVAITTVMYTLLLIAKYMK